MKYDENTIINHMNCLKCTREEAIDIIETDKKIDRGERVPSDLDPKLEKEIKKLYCNTHEHSKPKKKGNHAETGSYNFEQGKKEKKINPTKSSIISAIAEFLKSAGYENVIIANIDRMITFNINDTNFDLTLIQKRKSKK